MKLDPANPGLIGRGVGRCQAADIDRHVQRVGELARNHASGEAEHELAADRVDRCGGRGRRGLFDVPPGPAVASVVGRDCERTLGAFGEGGIGRNGKVGMKVEDPQCVAGVAELIRGWIDDGRRCAHRRRRQPVETRRQEAEDSLGMGRQIEVEVDQARGGIAGDHLWALEGVCAGPVEGPAVQELVDGHVVRIRPDGELGIVRKVVADRDEVVQVVRARWVRRLRDRDTLVVRGSAEARESELAQDPAIRQGIVDRDRISIVGGGTQPAERSEDAAHLEERGHGSAGLVEDSREQVDRLNVVIGPHRAVRVGRRKLETEGRLVVGDASSFEARDRSRHRERSPGALQRAVDVAMSALVLGTHFVLPLPDERARLLEIGSLLGQTADGLRHGEPDGPDCLRFESRARRDQGMCQERVNKGQSGRSKQPAQGHVALLSYGGKTSDPRAGCQSRRWRAADCRSEASKVGTWPKILGCVPGSYSFSD